MLLHEAKVLNAQAARELTERSVKEAKELAIRQLFLHIQKQAANCQTKCFVEDLAGLSEEQFKMLETMGYKVNKLRNGFEISWAL